MAQTDPRFEGFSDVVTTEAALRDAIGTPPPSVVAKLIHRLDDICRDFIARSPFLIVSTANPDGHIDISPKGDPPGFVKVLDDRRIAIPDRPGNRRADSFTNLLRDPRVGVMFIVPGFGEVLRIRGEGRIVRDRALRETMAVGGKVPALALVVYVEDAFMHCPKCMIRGGVWTPESWPDTEGLPDIGRAMRVHTHSAQTAQEQFDEAVRLGLTTLY